MSDGDRTLTLVGLGLAVLLVGGTATLVMSATSVGSDAADRPAADWTLTKLNDSYVRIEHAGGEPVRADKLGVNAEGLPRPVSWSDEVLVEGSTGVVHVGSKGRVALLWERSESQRALLAQWRLANVTGPRATPTGDLAVAGGR